MNIVILDGYTVNPGDISWEPIKNLGNCKIYDRTNKDQIVKRGSDADILITNKVILDREIISQLPRLKYISIIATGYNVVDLQAAKERDIIVTNIPNYCTSSVVQMTFAFILELARKVALHDSSVKNGNWVASKDFCYWDSLQIELTNKTFGIIGFGTIGKAVAKIALGFGMNISVLKTPTVKTGDLIVDIVDNDTLFKTSDFISLHCPLNEKTKEIINKTNLSLMKKTAFLINTARGPVVNELDLADALNNERIAGAGIDVLSVEPPNADNPLLKAKNCFVTPHIAWASRESRVTLLKKAAENMKAFFDGNPINALG